MDIANLLNEALQRKARNMQSSDLFDVIKQGLSAGDVMGTPQNQIERSLGKTPLEFNSMAQPQQGNSIINSDIRPPQKQKVEEPDRSWETPAIRARRELEDQKSKTKKQLQIDKETLPFYKKVKEISNSLPEIDARLDEMESLIDTGKTQWFGFLDSLSDAPYIGPFAGAIEQAFLTTESQVFKKLSKDFLRDAKPYFGSNMSTKEVELFLERVPSLALTNEGNRALIRNMRSLNDYSREVDAVLEGIIAENGGERPRHLESKVQARLKPATEKLKKSFKDSVKLIPQSQVRKARTQQKGAPEIAGSPHAKNYKDKFSTRSL